MTQSEYVVTQTDWTLVSRLPVGFTGWPERVLTPSLTREDATEALRGLQSRCVGDPAQYRMIPEWFWHSNEDLRQKSLSAKAVVPSYVKDAVLSMDKV